MVKLLWCWRCRMEIPMLEVDEWAVLMEAQRASRTSLGEAMAILEREARQRGLPAPEPFPEGSKLNPYTYHLLAGYRMFTGFEETNANAVQHHVVSYHGPPCPVCGKPLRTPQAKLCAACGWGMEGDGTTKREAES